MWDTVFAPVWSEALASAPHPLSEFKAADCRHARGEFKGWTNGERVDLMTSLVSVIVGDCPRDNIAGFATAVVLPPSPPNRKWRRELDELGMILCASGAIHDSLEVAQNMLDSANADDEVQIIFDEQMGYVGHTHDQFLRARRLQPEWMANRAPLPIFRDSKKTVPLQAADLLANETYKEVKSRIEQRPTSAALERLVANRFHRAHVFDVDLLQLYQRGTAEGATLTELPPPPFLYNYETNGVRDIGLWRTGGQQRGYWKGHKP